MSERVLHPTPSPDARSVPSSAGLLGLIAGNGRFPIIFAENARRLGYRVCAVAHVGETDPALADSVDTIHWVKIGQLGKLVDAFKRDGVTEAVMLGGIKKTHVFTTVRPDLRTLAMAARLAIWRDDDILREFAAELEREGIVIRESTFGLEGVLVPEGVLSRRAPTDKEWEDIRYGWEVAREIGRLDIGQCVVVKDRVVVAVEAVEGTDGAIKRGGELAKSGAVVVKRCKPQQDLRFDLPAIGPRTIDMMEAVKAKVLVADAGRSVMLDRDELLARANKAKIAVVGMASETTSNST
ncbi:MAG: UDP-2,3-diacylglucosamine diphosphatase LpxI [Nitrospiraceae bacterium]